MDWTNNYFDELYLKFFLENQKNEVTEAQVRIVENYIKGKLILDAGCGIGRHSILLSEKGYEIIGIDSSELYIEIAKKKASELKLGNIEFIKKDMREPLGDSIFDGIINLWSSFGYFDDDTNYKIIQNFNNALKKGGKFIIDLENRDYIINHFVYETFKEKEGVFILERRKFNPITSVISTHRIFLFKDQRKDYIRHLRIYTVTEISNILRNCKFQIDSILGDYDGSKFHQNSQRIIILARKL